MRWGVVRGFLVVTYMKWLSVERSFTWTRPDFAMQRLAVEIDV
jgi:hypothetical protein